MTPATADDLLQKTHVVLVDPPTGSTSQRTDDPDLGTPDDAIAPPEPLERLAAWSQINSTRGACIDVIATNTVGLGYTLEVKLGHEREAGDDPPERIRQATARLEALAARDKRLETPTLTELLKAVKIDEEEVGWGFIEVSRRKTDGEVDGLFHAPGKRMRRRKDRKGYILLGAGGGDDNTYFVPFGSKVKYDANGPTGELADDHPGGWMRNEVICFKRYTSESRDYGAPRDLALAIEYLGDKLANEFNAAYFDNGGALPTVIFVQGEEDVQGKTINVRVPAQVGERITSVLRSKGGDGAGRVAIIPVPAGVKAQVEQLGQIAEKDVGHVAFRDDIRQRTITAFRVSPIFLALAGDGQYEAEVERAITKEQVFDPEQTRYEIRLTNMILPDIGFGDLGIVFNDLAVEDDAARRSSAEKGAEVGKITNREYRTAHRWGPLLEAKQADTEFVWEMGDGGTYMSEPPEPGKVPFGWNDALMRPAGRPDGAQNRVVAGEGQQGVKPGIGGRSSRDRGQAASAAGGSRVEAQARRLQGRTGGGGARRALERARALPSSD